MKQSLGVLAVFLAYLSYFIIMIALLLFYSDFSEPVIGLVVLIFLTLYFWVLYTFRNNLNKKFRFTIKKV